MDENNSTKIGSAWGRRLTSLLEEKGVLPVTQWDFIEFILHRDAYQRKEVWFTDNIFEITGVLFESGSGRQGHTSWL